MTDLTLPQAKVLKYIMEYQLLHACMPSLMDIAKEFGSCKTSAQKKVQALEHKGYIKKHKGRICIITSLYENN